MQRSQRKRSAPSWLREKPYIKVRFTQDGVTTKVTESWNLKLTENGDTLKSSLANYSFHVGQIVWCYWKTAHETEKAYFEGKVIDLWDNALIVEESLPSEDQDEEAVDGTEDANVEVFPSPKKPKKTVKKTAKRLDKATNENDEEAKAAKRLANKEKANEEKAKQEDNLTQSKDIMAISDESMDMLFDFMTQIMSRLDSLAKKVDANQQNLDKLLRRIEKRKDHSLPVQVIVNKSGDSTDRPASPIVAPILCSTPKASHAANNDISNVINIEDVDSTPPIVHVVPEIHVNEADGQADVSPANGSPTISSEASQCGNEMGITWHLHVIIIITTLLMCRSLLACQKAH
ncbi:hypothetical protein OS493_024304 [Desmophyllum pertusum]|uniref:Uncharacterized protein n=1 Tax=Desmophyllum pertusum TaxID=174260 RepID=A0A9W9YY41_9CNID|nr:hypothetical protein OS493_024304 [Desmophyllum pertusum]